MAERIYLCIDLKSFYASVECVERGLDPMTTDLVVADPERSQGTICLAVSPSLKAKGVKNRCRVYEIPKGLEYIMAPPRMQKYIDYAADIYGIYIRYIAPEDIHVYSIDEAFLDVTGYLRRYGFSPREMAVFLMEKVREQLGIRATCGIGTNLYLTKIALDITAKHAPDFIGMLNEERYRETLWDHRPLTDFWRIGEGTARRLGHLGIFTMGQLAHAPEDGLYREFGVDAELLIDHAWGREPVTMADLKTYRPRTSSLSSGQVLMRDYSFEEAELIVREMTNSLCLDLLEQRSVTSDVTLWVSYSHQVLSEPARGSVSFDPPENADRVIVPAVAALYERITDTRLPVRRINISCNHLSEESGIYQLSLFDGEREELLRRSRMAQEAALELRRRFGKNALLRGIDLEEAATARERNEQIGGHKKG